MLQLVILQRMEKSDKTNGHEIRVITMIQFEIICNINEIKQQLVYKITNVNIVTV